MTSESQMKKVKRIFLICPVRSASDPQKVEMDRYVDALEGIGYRVHYPPRDTNQIDVIGGINILHQNMEAILKADEVHVYWDENSKGSYHDFGEAFITRKPIYVVNKSRIKPTQGKSYSNVLLSLDKHYEPNLIKRTRQSKEWQDLDNLVKKLGM